MREAVLMGMEIRRVVVLAPMPSEMAPIVAALQLQRDDAGVRRGRVGRVEVVAESTGMGLERATTAAIRAIGTHDPNHVVVVGIAGGVGASVVGELVCPVTVIDGATGRRYAAQPLSDANGVISSSDDFVVDPAAVAALIASGVCAIDMETAAVAAACGERHIAWSAIRVISDRATDHPDAAVVGLANADGSPNLRAALAFMARNPRRIPQLMRLGRDSQRAARAAAAELRRQLELVAAG